MIIMTILKLLKNMDEIINEIGDEFNFVILKSTDFILYNKKKIKNLLLRFFIKIKIELY